MVKIKKGNKQLEVSEKAFRVVYAPLGYVEVKAKARAGAKNDD